MFLQCGCRQGVKCTQSVHSTSVSTEAKLPPCSMKHESMTHLSFAGCVVFDVQYIFQYITVHKDFCSWYKFTKKGLYKNTYSTFMKLLLIMSRRAVFNSLACEANSSFTSISSMSFAHVAFCVNSEIYKHHQKLWRNRAYNYTLDVGNTQGLPGSACIVVSLAGGMCNAFLKFSHLTVISNTSASMSNKSVKYIEYLELKLAPMGDSLNYETKGSEEMSY